MATTVDGVQSTATFSFPITRKEYTPDGDLLVFGKATDGTVDSDNQIVDPEWSGKALQEWLATGGNVRVQHSPHLYPAGKGVEVVVGKDGAHWVRSMIVESTAKNLVEKGVLTSYSVGIARPQIVRSYEAPGGKIVGGIIAELSLVDRPANKNCAFELCKSAVDGQIEFVGKMHTFTEIDGQKSEDGMPTFTPKDLANVVNKREAAADLSKGAKDCPNCGSSFDADSSLRSCSDCGTKLPKGDKAADADLEEREDADLEKGSMPPQFAANAKKKTDGDEEDDDSESSDSDKPAFLTGKSAQPTDGVKAKDSKPLPRHREPDGGQVAALESDAGLGTEGEGASDGLPNGIWSENRGSNTPDTMKSASYSVNRLHDALCSAYHIDDIMGEYPTMKGLVGAMNDAWADLDTETRQIVKGVGEAASMDGTNTDTMILDEARATLSKSFGEMYPNVHVTPGKITAGQFTRPYLSAGHPQLSIQGPAHMPGPGDASFGSTQTMRDASQFNRSNITAGHASTSPGSAGNNGNSIPGSRPAGPRLAAAAKAQAANAMRVLHDHLAANHPYLCPMSPGTPAQIGAVAKASTTAETAELRGLVEKQAGELSELRAMVDQLGSQPDPNVAPHRGVVTKSASGGTGPADRRSLVEEALTAEDRERAKFYGAIAASGDAGLREAAQRVLRNQTPTN
jgi:hypothetical protein